MITIWSENDRLSGPSKQHDMTQRLAIRTIGDLIVASIRLADVIRFGICEATKPSLAAIYDNKRRQPKPIWCFSYIK